MSEHPRDKFERTTCDCHECTKCCEHMPGVLVPGDVERIRKHVDPTGWEDFGDWLLTHFEASEGYRVLRGVQQDDGSVQLYDLRVPTIVPKKRASGCVFLDEGRCTIHEVAPFGCTHFDVHMDAERADDRTKAALAVVEDDWREGGAYADLWARLKVAGAEAAPVEERRAGLRAALEKTERKSSVGSLDDP